jgi:hypothetical protein
MSRASIKWAAFWGVFWLGAGVSPLFGHGEMTTPSQPSKATTKPKWHSIVIMPNTNQPPIHLYDKFNPLWWFRNLGEPNPPDSYRPNSHFRNLAWHIRNPLNNFSNYVIGIGDKTSVRSGWYPDKVANPNGGWSFAVSRRSLLYLPFIDYKRDRFEFYFGWRKQGIFGIKLNFHQALPKTKSLPGDEPSAPSEARAS